MASLVFCIIPGRVILSLFLGILLAIAGWLLAVFLAKAVNSSFQLKARHHVLSFLIAVLTFIVYQFIAVTGNGLRYIDQAASVIKTELAGNHFLQQQIRSIADQVPQTGGPDYQEKAGAFICRVNDAIKQKYPLVNKALNLNKLEQDKNFQKRLVRSLADLEKNNTPGLIGAFADQYIAGLRRPLAHTRLKMIILLVAVQLVQVVVLMVKANRSPVPVFYDSYDSSSDY